MVNQQLLSERWLEIIALPNAAVLRRAARFWRLIMMIALVAVYVAFSGWPPSNLIIRWMLAYGGYLLTQELLRTRVKRRYNEVWLKVTRQQVDLLALSVLYWIVSYRDVPDAWLLYLVPIFLALIYFESFRPALLTAGEASIVIWLLRVQGGQNAFMALASAAVRGGFLFAVAYLLHKLLTALKEAQTSRDVSVAMIEGHTESELCQQLAEMAMSKIANAQAAVVHLVGRDRDRTLIPRASMHLDPTKLGKTPLRVGKGVAGVAVASKHTVYCRDARIDPIAADVPGIKPAIRSILSAPMRVGDKDVGVISVHSDRVTAFDKRDERFLTLLANQGGIALANAELAANRRRLRNRLKAVLESTIGFVADLPLAVLFEQIARGVSEASGFEVTSVMILDEDREAFLCVATHGLPEEGKQKLEGSKIPRQILDSYLSPDYLYPETHCYYVHYDRRPSLPDIGAYSFTISSESHFLGGWHPEDILLVPMLTLEGEEVGYISVDAPVDAAIPALETIQALEIHGQMAASAIKRARLVKRIVEEQEKLRLLNKIALAAQRNIGLERVLHIVLTAITSEDGLAHDRAALFVLNPDHTCLVGVAGAGRLTNERPQVIDGHERRDPVTLDAYLDDVMGGGEMRFTDVHERVVGLKIPLLAESHEAFSKVVQSGKFLHAAAGDVLSVAPELASVGMHVPPLGLIPLTVRDELFGVLACHNGSARGPFDDPQMALLVTIASEAAIAVDNDRLARQNQEVLGARVRNEERRHLESDLHQAMGTLATGVKWEAELAIEEIDEGHYQEAGDALTRSLAALSRAYTDLEFMLTDLRTAALAERGLLAAIREYGSLIGSGRIAVDGEELDELPPKITNILFRLAQEGMTNAVKHSGALANPDGFVAVWMGRSEQSVRLTVTDNGKGFDAKTALTSRSHWGLRRLHESARGIGGTFEVESEPGVGTRLSLTLPVSEEK